MQIAVNLYFLRRILFWKTIYIVAKYRICKTISANAYIQATYLTWAKNENLTCTERKRTISGFQTKYKKLEHFFTRTVPWWEQQSLPVLAHMLRTAVWLTFTGRGSVLHMGPVVPRNKSIGSEFNQKFKKFCANIAKTILNNKTIFWNKAILLPWKT